MKNKLLIFVTVFLIFTLCAVSVSAAGSPRLYDGADLLTDAQEEEILALLDSATEKYNVELVIATVDDVDEDSIDEYDDYYFDNGGYGIGDRRDGVLLLVSMLDRDYRILSNGLGADAISTDDIDYIGELVADYLSDEEYAAAFRTFVERCEYEIDGEINGFPFKAGTNFVIALVIGFIVAFIVTGIWRGQLKSVRQQRGAAVYTKDNSMNITRATDFYLYRTVQRTKKESSSSSSSSGSSRNSGGGKF